MTFDINVIFISNHKYTKIPAFRLTIIESQKCKEEVNYLEHNRPFQNLSQIRDVQEEK